MTVSKSAFALAATLVFSFTSHSYAEGDADKGKKVFNKCRACHVVDKPKNRVGPSLQGVMGRAPGTYEDFKYSKAMIAYGEDHVWDEETLAAYLAAPKKVVEGTKMIFPGLKKEADIANIIAYIKGFSE